MIACEHVVGCQGPTTVLEPHLGVVDLPPELTPVTHSSEWNPSWQAVIFGRDFGSTPIEPYAKTASLAEWELLQETASIRRSGIKSDSIFYKSRLL